MRKITHSRRIGLPERLYPAPSLVIGNPSLAECVIERGLEYCEHAIGCGSPAPHQFRVVRIECASPWLQRAAFRSQPGGALLRVRNATRESEQLSKARAGRCQAWG